MDDTARIEDSVMDDALGYPTADGLAMTPATAAAFWEELQRGLRFVHYIRQPPSHRRRRMGEMRVTITERRVHG